MWVGITKKILKVDGDAGVGVGGYTMDVFRY